VVSVVIDECELPRQRVVRLRSVPTNTLSAGRLSGQIDMRLGRVDLKVILNCGIYDIMCTVRPHAPLRTPLRLYGLYLHATHHLFTLKTTIIHHLHLQQPSVEAK